MFFPKVHFGIFLEQKRQSTSEFFYQRDPFLLAFFRAKKSKVLHRVLLPKRPIFVLQSQKQALNVLP
jgi:hypothetical protein